MIGAEELNMKKHKFTEHTPYDLYRERWEAIFEKLNNGLFTDKKSKTLSENCEDTKDDINAQDLTPNESNSGLS